MASRVRSRLLLPALVACAGAFWLAWQALTTMAFTDYEIEAEPALDALRHGHVGDFLTQAPAYGGSLILRAPFALAPNLWDGGALALFRDDGRALPCRRRAAGRRAVGAGPRPRPRPARGWLALVLCAANPLTIRALEIGHPEELLVGALVVFAALAAYDGRPLLTGVLLGPRVRRQAVGGRRGGADPRAAARAPASSPSASPPRRARCSWRRSTSPASATRARPAASARPATSTGIIFQPWQAWWFLAQHGQLVMGTYAPHYGYRAAPSWIEPFAHPFLVVAMRRGLGRLVALRRPADRRLDGLLLLAFAPAPALPARPLEHVLLRDPVPPGAHRVGGARPPRPAAAVGSPSTALAWLTLTILPRHITPDMQSLAFLGWSVPLAAAHGAAPVRASSASPARWRRCTRWPRAGCPRSWARRLADDRQALVEGREHLGALLGDERPGPRSARRSGRARRRRARRSRRCPARSVRGRRCAPGAGASWISRPTPWPSPWPKCSPWPAALDHLARHRVDLAPAAARPRPPPARPPAARSTSS